MDSPPQATNIPAPQPLILVHRVLSQLCEKHDNDHRGLQQSLPSAEARFAGPYVQSLLPLPITSCNLCTHSSNFLSSTIPLKPGIPSPSLLLKLWPNGGRQAYHMLLWIWNSMFSNVTSSRCLCQTCGSLPVSPTCPRSLSTPAPPLWSAGPSATLWSPSGRG